MQVKVHPIHRKLTNDGPRQGRADEDTWESSILWEDDDIWMSSLWAEHIIPDYPLNGKPEIGWTKDQITAAWAAIRLQPNRLQHESPWLNGSGYLNAWPFGQWHVCAWIIPCKTHWPCSHVQNTGSDDFHLTLGCAKMFVLLWFLLWVNCVHSDGGCYAPGACVQWRSPTVRMSGLIRRHNPLAVQAGCTPGYTCPHLVDSDNSTWMTICTPSVTCQQMRLAGRFCEGPQGCTCIKSTDLNEFIGFKYLLSILLPQ